MTISPTSKLEASNALAHAIVDTVREPFLVLDKDLKVIAANQSFYRGFRVDRERTEGRLLHELGDGQWDIPSLRVFLKRVTSEDGVVEAYEVEQTFPAIGHRIMCLNGRKIVLDESYGGATVLIAIEDVTERVTAERERDQLLRQKEMLLEEMEHRVANSLQIIASILLIKARAVSSEETRTHLYDAHKRVLAVASVQKHLHSSTGIEAIQLEPYLVQLCASLAGAMIAENEGTIALRVQVTGGCVSSKVAVGLGLAITELVINALKYAFPIDGPDHTIDVAYTANDLDWTLTVGDNGIGKDHLSLIDAKGGLGTSIVNALAAQLDARVETKSSAAGTSVSLIHVAAQNAA